MKTVIKFTKPYIGLMIIAIILMLSELFVDMYAPILMKNIIDNGILKNDTGYIQLYLLIMLALSAMAFVAGILNSFISSHVCHMFSYDIRNALFRKIQGFSLKTLSRFKTSSLITRLTSDVIANEMVLFMSLRIMLKAPLSVIGSIIMSFIVAPDIALYLIMGTPLLALFLFFTARAGMKIFLIIQQRTDGLNRFIQQNLEGVRLIKSTLNGPYETEKFDDVASPIRVDTVRALRLMESIMPVLLLIMNGSLLLVIWFGSDLIQVNTLEVGSLVAVINYALRMQGGFSMFAFIIIAFSRAKSSADRISEVLLAPADEVVLNDDSHHSYHSNTVEFRNVTFKYPTGQQNVLEDISFKVNVGEKFVIMGQTGSGKSALLSLIPRMYEVSAGQILVNQQDVRDWDIKALRDFIGYVPQKTTLFTGSIIDNVRWGDSAATSEEVFNATQIAQIHDSIMNFDDDYATKVGQQGVNLSGGQKQRLAIARALIKKPGILILDDSTSALDIHTENRLFDSLKELDMTRIIVTQKIHTAKTADHILLLEAGHIVALGTHEELMNSSQLYRDIADSQGEAHD
ncbi:ABC transporter ATP-binding protein [Macrococcus hajekii]|uniref:ABC transporter ATP-binding protein n=1 Tax=Macrococcus hajekii TaxID=198482 RepID=A0A4R6BMS9_9STAP|nr:ABC transporter ATP-binding protein [Macrococcus hajekii]TDM03126.1 ABC transporter ATP-binding protein [Macrococcus hajekii]GGA96176.1 putative ABC transporter ATP-binding protein YfiB [Macrococcus hajekii]